MRHGAMLAESRPVMHASQVRWWSAAGSLSEMKPATIPPGTRRAFDLIGAMARSHQR
jgi:hypothetical protein